jgi:hypothetical protein
MDLIVTTALLAFSIALMVFFGWRGARPPDIRKGPRLVPYRLLMLLMAGAILVLVTHEVSFLGLKKS